MHIERCTNVGCRRPFFVFETGGSMPPDEEIECSHCGFTAVRVNDGAFHTSALSEECEAAYSEGHPL
jgi:hypothetical protein